MYFKSHAKNINQCVNKSVIRKKLFIILIFCDKYKIEKSFKYSFTADSHILKKAEIIGGKAFQRFQQIGVHQ